jgi:hypothetical protein
MRMVAGQGQDQTLDLGMLAKVCIERRKNSRMAGSVGSQVDLLVDGVCP